MSDRWIRCISKGGSLVATAITAGNLVETARGRHHIGYTETKVLGEALMGGLLLASTCKPGERVSLSIKGDRFLRQAMVDANPDGTVRGFVIAKELQEDIDPNMGPWQNGLLSVARLKKNEKEPYVGTVPIVTGYLAKDLTYYLNQSEQIPSAVGLTVNIAQTGKVDSAGAFLVQVMPGASKEEIDLLEQNINTMEALASQVATDSNPTKLLGQIFNNMTFLLLEEKPLQFQCNCSKERIVRALKLLGTTEVQAMINEDHGANVSCDFCGSKFAFSETELKQILEEIEYRK